MFISPKQQKPYYSSSSWEALALHNPRPVAPLLRLLDLSLLLPLPSHSPPSLPIPEASWHVIMGTPFLIVIVALEIAIAFSTATMARTLVDVDVVVAISDVVALTNILVRAETAVEVEAGVIDGDGDVVAWRPSTALLRLLFANP